MSPKLTFAFDRTQGVYHGPGKVDPAANVLRLNAFVTLKPTELGLKSPPLSDEIDLRIGMSGFSHAGDISK